MSKSPSIYDSNEISKEVSAKKAKKPLSKKKKIIFSVVCVLLVGALIAGAVFLQNKKSSSSNAYAYVRTTELSKGSLENSISATGTVESAQTSNVTTSLSYTVESILVSVGDEVEKGETICTLDTSELTEQIEREKSNLEESLESAQSSYDSALSSYNKEKKNYDTLKATLDSAEKEKSSAYSAFKIAKSAVSSYQSSYDSKLAKFNKAGAAFVKAQTNYNKAVSDYKNGKISSSKLLSYASAYVNAVQNYYGGCKVGSFDISDTSSASSSVMSSASSSAQGSQNNDNSSAGSSSTSAVSVSQTADDICKNVASTVYSLTKSSVSYTSKTGALYNLASAAQSLKNAKSSCNYYSLESSYNTAKSTYDTAKNSLEQSESSLEQSKQQCNQAKQQLSSASSSDTLEELESQLSECTVKATQSGTVTSLNAVVGSSANGAGSAGAGGSSAIATINNLDKLKVSITIQEADINDAVIGMSCYITSDASDETINGTLTQIDPTAGDSGSFGAEVTVDDSDTSLKIGMNASVELIVSSKDDVYQVPIDAVGNDDTGDFVYRKTSGEGTDMEFEKVYVTTGDKNDYYVEITGESLSDGDVIRSSSNLEEGIETGETSEKESNGLASLFGGMGSNSMRDSGSKSNNMGSAPNNSSGGTPPSGNFPGGGN